MAKHRRFTMIKRANRGLSLFIVMLFTGIVLAGLSVLWNSQNGKILRDKVATAAWEGVQIARAARLHVRNQIAATVAPAGSSPRQVVATAAAGSPQITIAQLIAENLLPQNFLAGKTTNALGQQIQIVMQNFPVGGAITDDDTIPTAYVYFRQNPRIAPNVEARLMNDVAAQMNRIGVMVSAPLYDAGGTNITTRCGTTPSVSHWDTGCLTNANATTITGTAFQQGSLLIPAWRSATFDTRAVMRFPQPEQSGLNTLLVDLFMGETNGCANQVQNSLNADMASVNLAGAALCDAVDDDPALLTDNRRSILRPGPIDTDNLVIDAQAGNDVQTYTGTTSVKVETNNTLTVPGNLVTNSGDIGVRGDQMTVTGNVGADRNLYVSGATPTTTSIASLTADNIDARTLTVNNTVTTSAQISSANSIQNINNLSVSGGGNFSSQTMTATGNNQAFRFNTLAFSSGNVRTVTVRGTQPTPYSLLAQTFSSGAMNVAGNMNVVSSNGSIATVAQVGGTLLTNNIDITNGGGAWCRGDCPPRQYCTNFAAHGYTSYAACIAALSP